MVSDIEKILSDEEYEEFRDAYVFVSVVSLIFKRSREEESDIRDLLTYLLLKRNPRTNEKILLEYRNAEESKAPDKVEVLREVVSRMHERYISGIGKTTPYPILQLLDEMNLYKGSSWINGEEISLLIMSMCLFTKTLSCNDIYIKYACLKLYKRHLKLDQSSVSHEMTYDRTESLGVIVDEAERLCSTELPTDEIAKELAYLGSFVSLLRSVRIGISVEVRDVLRNEVARLQTETKLGLGVNNDHSRH